MRMDDERIERFVTNLDELSKGERARFKRNAGKDMSDSHRVVGTFFRVLPYGVSRWDEQWFFLVATLFPLTESDVSRSLGQSLRRARTDENADGLDRRMEVLLDADISQLPFRLRQVVQLLASKDVSVNWARLLSDLTNWTHPNRFVQERWARDYFSGGNSSEDSENTKE